MSNPDIGELLTVSIDSRRRKLSDNVTDNTALLYRLKSKGKINRVSGGNSIFEELEYTENETYKRFSGYEVLDIRPSNVMTSAKYDWRQVSVAVTISGLDQLKNAGKERMIPLLARRISNAEKTMINGLSGDLYSDGTADGGKQVDGLQLAVDTSPATGVYAGINPANNAYWRNYAASTAPDLSDDTIKQIMMLAWVNTCRNMDKVDLIPCDNTYYRAYWKALQDQQRFTSAKMGRMGFTNLKFDTADVVLDGGVGGSCPANRMFFLNTDYLHWRPHANADMVSPKKRMATNQDAEVRLLLWAGNLTTSNRFLQGVLSGTVTA